MWNNIKKKTGAVAVLVTLIFVSTNIAAITIFNASADALKVSVYDGAINVASRSILSEYDSKLFEDYGIFAYSGSENNIDKKCIRYLKANTSRIFKPLNAKNIDILIDNKEYSLIEVDNLAPQLIEAGKVNIITQPKKVKNENPVLPSKTVNNKAIISGLPSGNKSNISFDFSSFDMDGVIGERLTESALINQYIDTVFKSRFSDYPNRNSFFNYEKEYILSGKMSELGSLEYVKRQIYLLRLPLNTEHILTDGRKMAVIEKYIAALPTTADPIEAAALVAIWAASETENDINRLLNGDKVAFIKNDRQWALSLEQAILNIFLRKIIEPNDSEGYDYDDYLMALMYVKNRETKLLRIMDLIQINMKSTYRGDFLIKEHYVGFNIIGTIDGREYQYKHSYYEI